MKTGFVSLCASVALCVMAATPAVAQTQPPKPPPAPPSQPPQPAALSVPNPFAGLHPGPRDLYQSPDGSDRFQHLSRYPAPPPVLVTPGIYWPGPYGFPTYYPTVSYGEYQQPYQPPIVARGGLALETSPDFAQVYVDGYYVGLAEEFGARGRPIDIPAGTHRIELRSPDYETLSFSVIVAPNDIVRFRGDMQRLPTQAPLPRIVPAAPQSARSYYVIPGCYAGDKPPAAPLPAGCDLKKLKTVK